LSSWR